ncbi:MAG: ABC transporter ATP-binding protein [Rhodospirillaceae bacterium]|nr:ABC transporter ATP-binding protein [Rhodospirillaceae bacterium]
MAINLLSVRGLYKTFGGVAAIDHVDLDVAEGEVHAVIGPNGAGKTTLVAQLSGELDPEGGAIDFDGQRITGLPAHARAHLGIARSFQITSLMLDMSVVDNAILAIQAQSGHSYRFWADARSEDELIGPAIEVLERVGLDEMASRMVRALSHGEHRQLEIALALAAKPKLLLLDEPMAGMGAEEVRDMVVLLGGLKQETTILLIEHDMDAVFALADRITVLVYGRVIASGSPEAIRGDFEVRRAYLGEEA